MRSTGGLAWPCKALARRPQRGSAHISATFAVATLMFEVSPHDSDVEGALKRCPDELPLDYSGLNML
jgi:hypothetical protein